MEHLYKKSCAPIIVIFILKNVPLTLSNGLVPLMFKHTRRPLKLVLIVSHLGVDDLKPEGQRKISTW